MRKARIEGPLQREDPVESGCGPAKKRSENMKIEKWRTDPFPLLSGFGLWGDTDHWVDHPTKDEPTVWQRVHHGSGSSGTGTIGFDTWAAGDETQAFRAGQEACQPLLKDWAQQHAPSVTPPYIPLPPVRGM